MADAMIDANYASGWQAARLVDKILKGTPPREIPVEVSTKLKFVINLKTATALGLALSQSCLLEAESENGISENQ